MTNRTLYTALLAAFVAASAALPLQAQVQQEAQQAQSEELTGFESKTVTVNVANYNWLDMRVYVVETATSSRRWPLGNVVGLTQATFEIPDHLQAHLGHLVMVAEPIGSPSRAVTDVLPTYGGSVVNWEIGHTLGHSTATVW